jgi:hypothetical protein
MLMLNMNCAETQANARGRLSPSLEQLLSKTRIKLRTRRNCGKKATMKTAKIIGNSGNTNHTQRIVRMVSNDSGTVESEENDTDDSLDDQFSPPAQCSLLSPVSSVTDDDEDDDCNEPSIGKHYSFYSSEDMERVLRAAISASIVSQPPLTSIEQTVTNFDIDNGYNKNPSTTNTPAYSSNRRTRRFVISRSGKVYKSSDLNTVANKTLATSESDYGSSIKSKSSTTLTQLDNPLIAPSEISLSPETALLSSVSKESLQQREVLDSTMTFATPLGIVRRQSTATLSPTQKQSSPDSYTISPPTPTLSIKQDFELCKSNNSSSSEPLASTKKPRELTTFSIIQTPLYERRPHIPLALYYIYEDSRWLLMTALQTRLRRRGLLKESPTHICLEPCWDEPAVIIKSAAEVYSGICTGNKFVQYRRHMVEEWDEYGIQRRMVPARWVAKRADDL